MGVVKAGRGKRARVGGQVGNGADVSRAEDELHAKTESHRCLHYSLEQEGGGKENRDIVKLQAILTHSPAGPQTDRLLTHEIKPHPKKMSDFNEHINI